MTPAKSRSASGRWAEDWAARQIEAAGLRLVTRNYRCPSGEIDLVAEDRGALVFIEVRYRRRSGHGTAAESIDYRKQSRIINSARHFLLANSRYGRSACRFDVMLLAGEETAPQVEWIRDAFQA